MFGTIGKTMDGLAGAFGQVCLSEKNNEQGLLQDDRSTVVGAGASVITTQVAVSPTAFGSLKTEVLKASVDAAGNQFSQGERFFPIGNFVWDPSYGLWDTVIDFSFPDALLQKKFSLSGILDYHTFARWGVEVVVSVSPTNFQVGGLLVCLIPNGSEWADIKCNAMQFPHAIINCNINNQVAIKVPYVWTKGMHSIHYDKPMWHLRVMCWSPLKVSAGSSTKCTGWVQARLANLEVHGLCPATQGKTVLLDCSSYALNMCNQQGTEPTLDMSINCESFKKDLSCCGGMEVTDLSHQMHTPCMSHAFEVTTTTEVGTLLWSFVNGPAQPGNRFGDTYQETALTLLTNYFNLWRGDIVWTFQCFPTKFHSGKLLISFIPGRTSVPTFEDVMTSYTLVWDLVGVQSAVKFKVPFISGTEYRSVRDGTGIITVWCYTQLAAPDSVPHAVNVNIYQNTEKDFIFYSPSWRGTIAQAGDDDEGAAAFEHEPHDEELKPEPAHQGGQVLAPIEDAAVMRSKTGTFPETSHGKELHSSSHMKIANLMGRAHYIDTFVFDEPGKVNRMFFKLTPENFDKPLRGLMRLGLGLRGPLCIIVTLTSGTTPVNESDQNTTNFCFLPHDQVDVSLNDFELTSLGVVRVEWTQTTAVKLKIPWYTTLSMINMWGGDDVNFGTLLIETYAKAAWIGKVELAFTPETQLCWPMPMGPKDQYVVKAPRRALNKGPFMDHGEDETDAVAQSGEFDTPAGRSGPTRCWLALQHSGLLYDHYGVIVDDLCVFSFGPYDMSKKWWHHRNGTVFCEPINEGLPWIKLGEAHDGPAVLDICLGMLGTEMFYEIFSYNCETWARTVTGIYDKTQLNKVDLAAKCMVVGGLATCAISGAIMAVTQGGNHRVYMTGNDASGFRKIVKKAFKAAGATVVNSGANADYTVVVMQGRAQDAPNAEQHIVNLVTSMRTITPIHAVYVSVDGSCEHQFRYANQTLNVNTTEGKVLLTNEVITAVNAFTKGVFTSERGWKERVADAVDAPAAISNDIAALARDASEMKDTVTSTAAVLSTDMHDLKVVIDETSKPLTKAAHDMSNVSKTIDETAEEFKKTSVAATGLLNGLKGALDSATKGLKGKKKSIAGNVTSGFLNTVASILEVVAAFKAKGEVRALILGAITCRGVAGLSAMMADYFEHQGAYAESGDDNGPDVTDHVLNIVETGMRKTVKGGAPKASLKDSCQEMNIYVNSLLNLEKLAALLMRIVEAVSRWIAPKSPKAILHKTLAKAVSRVPVLLTQVDDYLVKKPQPGRKKAAAAQGRALYHKCTAWKCWLLEGKENKHAELCRVVSAACTMLAKKILDLEANEECGASRTEPYVVWLAGDKGSGKSVLSLMLAGKMCTALGTDIDSGIYTKPPGAEYYDGYDQQPILLIDDMGQQTDGEDFTDFCQMVSCAPVRLNMARLEDKGKPFSAPLIIASSNVKSPSPPTVATQAAVLRRLQLCVTVKPHKDYMSSDGTLNLEKAMRTGAIGDGSCWILTEYSPSATLVHTGGPITLPEMLTKITNSLTHKAMMHDNLMSLIRAHCQGNDDIIEQLGGVDDDENIEAILADKYKCLQDVIVKYDKETNMVYFEDKPLVEEWNKKKPHFLKKHKYRIAFIAASMLGAAAAIMGIGYGIFKAIDETRRGKETKTEQRAYEGPGMRSPRRVKKEEVATSQAHADVMRVARGNMVSFGVEKQTPSGGRICWLGSGMFLKAHTFVTAKHMLINSDNFVISDYSEVPVIYERSACKEHDIGDDLIAITVPAKNAKMYRDITEHLLSESDYPKLTHTAAIVYGMTNESCSAPLSELHVVGEFSYLDQPTSTTIQNSDIIRASGNTQKGYCGKPWISLNTRVNTGIIGLHVAGSPGHAYCQPLTKEAAMAALHASGEGRVVSHRPFPNKIPQNQRNSHQKTPIHEHIMCDKKPAPLWPKPGVENDPQAYAMMKWRAPLKACPPGWSQCVEYYKAKMSGFRKNNHVNGVPLRCTLTEVVEGMEGMEGLDMKTSPGYPWNQYGVRKKDLIYKENDEWVMRDDLKSLVDKTIEYIDDPNVTETPDIIYTVYLKDELLTKAKADLGRTRAIHAAPLHLVLAWKIMLGHAISAMHRDNPSGENVTGCAVGIDPEKEWTGLYHAYKSMSIMCIDFSNFDGSMQPWLLQSACDLICYAAGLEDFQADKVGPLIYNVEQVMGQDLVHTYGPLPSGAPSTSLIGSLANILMCTYVLHHKTGLPYRLTDTRTRIVTYGDDVLFGVNPHDAQAIDTAGFCRMLTGVFGVEATSATDKTKPPEWVTITGATFLKRGFRKCPDGHFCHPTMDLGTVNQLLAWKRKDASFSENVVTACDFAFHHGRDVYDDWTRLLMTALRNSGADPVGSLTRQIPHYDDLHSEWMFKCS